MSGGAHITVQVRYFASLREALGICSEAVTTQAPTVGALQQELAARGGPYAEVLAPGRAVRVALGQVMSSNDVRLTAGAEVAFFPPVTGG